jgi:hypothetical protein
MTQPPGSARSTRAQILPLEELGTVFRDAVCGPRHRGRPEVIWSDGGSQIRLHVGKLQVRTAGAALLIAVDTESAEFGVAPLIVRFVFGTDKGPASLIAATDDRAFGHPQVAARWGDLFRDVIWAALTRLIEVRSGGQAPAGLQFGPDGLQLSVQTPFSTVDLAVNHVNDLVQRGLRARPGERNPA